MTPRVLIADYHTLIRKGVKQICQNNLSISHVKEVNSLNQLMQELHRDEYTHLIFDLVFQDGTLFEILPNITQLYPELRFMLFTMQSPSLYKKAMVKHKIFNYCTKDTGFTEIVSQINLFFNNQIPTQQEPDIDQENPFKFLSNREMEVLHYILKGDSNNQIAAALNIKWNTVSTYRRRILEKTQTSNVMALKDLAQLYLSVNNI